MPVTLTTSCRWLVNIDGPVQGVGLRPWIYQQAIRFNLTGWVANSLQGVVVEIQGDPSSLELFWLELDQHPPFEKQFVKIQKHPKPLITSKTFTIRESHKTGTPSAWVLPDVAICAECRNELFEVSNRRKGYPFTSCTKCGPRFSVVTGLPYDREQTTYSDFPMCSNCTKEYKDPNNRRFHSQTNVCPDCGPQINLWDKRGNVLSEGSGVLREAVGALQNGQIIAVKGWGGFHLMVDARNQNAVQRLRNLKHRPDKPFGVMAPNLEWVKEHLYLSEMEEQLLVSSHAPLLLLNRYHSQNDVAQAVAPNQPMLGVLLPFTGIHMLLMNAIGSPLVATSGNISNECICFDEHEAVKRLHGLVDLFLVHNLRLARSQDDSVLRIMADRPMILRRSRGYAPLPVASSCFLANYSCNSVLCKAF